MTATITLAFAAASAAFLLTGNPAPLVIVAASFAALVAFCQVGRWIERRLP